ncbi:MAG: ergothioneine biosynthesis protein EgtB [Cytophagaceae bacterium]
MEVLRTVESDVLSTKYRQVRSKTRQLCLPLQAEDMIVQPMMDASPTKWHLGHTTWFFESFVLKKYHRSYRPYNPDFDFLFNSYYDSLGTRLARDNRGILSRPPLKDVVEFREYVDEALLDLLDKNNLPQKARELIELGMQHEQQHQELLITDIKYVLGSNPLYPIYHSSEIHFEKPLPSALPEYHKIEEGIYEIGYQGNEFCYDNEKPVHKVYLNEFKIRTKLVTNGEYLDFIQDGGYEDFRHWLTEGWAMVNKDGLKAPLFWRLHNGEWHEYALSGLKKLNPDQPVAHISFYEANAYANWAGQRLLTEFEWEVACKTINPDRALSNFAENELYHPVQASRNATQLLGDLWEWTYSAYHPYPGYKREKGALGEYNGKFMLNQMVLKGGSCASPAEHIRPSYRNFFHPDKRWQFTGIRLGT